MNNMQENKMETPREKLKNLFSLVKQLDEQKKSAVTISHLFEPDVEKNRNNLVKLCYVLLFKDYSSIGKKSREILWRRGYYDFISFVKKMWSKDEKENDLYRSKLQNFLLDGINLYKNIVDNIETFYDLDLRYLVDFSILNNFEIDDMRLNHTVAEKTIPAISYALETIHSSLLSLGDLHRYFIDFNLDKCNITKDITAKFYFEAFKLNPTIGMAQNQLGTLYYNQNYDIDSLYHYFYSLICTVPFDLSETNIGKLILSHADYLEKIGSETIEFSLKDFFARFFLVVDIFFFDKDVPGFNSLCHCVLVDLKKILCSQTIKLPKDCLFKIICILMFCVSKLKMINSQKIYSMNAFLVAVCSDLLDACIVNLEHRILEESMKNIEFQRIYEKMFDEFENVVRKNRGSYKHNEKIQVCKKPLPLNASNGQQSSIGSDKIINLNQIENIQLNIVLKGESIISKSSDEAKESELKTPCSFKTKRRNTKIRRRRKIVQHSNESSSYDSESDSDSRISNTDYSDLSSNFESDFKDDENSQFDEKSNSDTEEIVSDHEENVLSKTQNNILLNMRQNEIFNKTTNHPQLIEEFASFDIKDPLFFKQDNKKNLCSSQKSEYKNEIQEYPISNLYDSSDSSNFQTKLKYKSKYLKINPNIIIDALQDESVIKCLKILFDWLRINHEVLLGCYHTNPEFVHKIMKLLNYCNIDIFTRKVYFERSLINIPNLREDLHKLFEKRGSIPLSEDLTLKNFDILQSTQAKLDWEATLRDKITETEEKVLRIFKIVDFGFFICKMKKFDYIFCSKSRNFIEKIKKKRNRRLQKEKRSTNGCTKLIGRPQSFTDKYYTNNEEKEPTDKKQEIPIPIQRKGYLRNRSKASSDETQIGNEIGDKTGFPLKGKKCEIMGQLWLKSEVESLELKIKKKYLDVVLTPYIVVDAKSLTEYTGIVKILVKSKKFVVLIPNAVLGELDELKKYSERARNTIRWLEKEFKRGNRHLRSQRDNEKLNLTLFKLPKKLSHEATVFLQIAQFCNFIVTNHSDEKEYELDIITFLTGDILTEKKLKNFSYTGILNAIPVRFDQISLFYDKYKKK